MKRSISWLAVVGLVVAFAGPAHAEDEDDKEDVVNPEEDKKPSESTEDKKPPPPTTTAPETTPKADEPSEGRTGLRPAAKSLGLGFGYTFPSDVQLINTVSARIVWSDKLIFEPLFELSFGSDSASVGGMDTSDSATTMAVGTEIRYQMWSRRRTGLSMVMGAGVAYTKDNPDGDDNNTSTLGFGLSWGVGLDLWIWKDWGLSFTLTNPFFSYGSTTQQAPGDDVTNSSTFFGLVWDDSQVRFMLHSYF